MNKQTKHDIYREYTNDEYGVTPLQIIITAIIAIAVAIGMVLAMYAIV